MRLYKGTTVFVKDGNVERALRKFKKKVQKKGTIQEVRDRQEFIKPSAKKKLSKDRAIRKNELEVKRLKDQLNTRQR